MDNQEQQLIDDIRTLFKELIEEEDERYDNSTKRPMYPRNTVYVNKVQELICKASELENNDSKYSTHELKTILGKELYYIENHKYKYEKGTLIPCGKSLNEIQNLMHNATYHIKLYLYDVLGDININ